MQIYDLLIDDHQRIKMILENLVKSEPNGFELRAGLLNQLKSEFVPHARAEESVLYDAIRNLDGIKEMALESYDEHLEAETLLQSLTARSSYDLNWMPLAKELKQTIEDHIYHEENEMFSIARALFTEEDAENMGRAFEQVKFEMQETTLKEAG